MWGAKCANNSLYECIIHKQENVIGSVSCTTVVTDTMESMADELSAVWSGLTETWEEPIGWIEI